MKEEMLKELLKEHIHETITETLISEGVIEDTGDTAWAVIESKKIEILEEMLKDLKR